ncbi:hypothetical protein AALO_G00061680 [Alosa alosa]|uniref:HTH CENPB-type domain-containing protein n=1 Tax=Alosa alosa TaxID=278164 RepID=A0AAV6H0K8_9TELE|nr:MFS-type transporter clz9-like isoform X2 [Alosa alosa]KAG5280574.1 hypothetical protein AALO_G00061680 [Alosa alosa]
MVLKKQWKDEDMEQTMEKVAEGMPVRQKMRLKKQWKDEDMVQAMEKVAEGMPVRQACQVFNVPRNTLRDRVMGVVTHGCRTGPSQKLSVEEEQALVEYYQCCADHGFPITRARLQAYATAVLRKRTRKPELRPLGVRWYHCFKKRHAAISMNSVNIDRLRSTCVTLEPVIHFFDLLEKTVNEHGLRNKPAQVYHCDKTELMSQRETKHPSLQAPSTRDHVSILACFNAAGEDIPPLIIYPKYFPGGQYTTGGPPNALYGKSPDGNMDSKLFLRWLQHFILHARQERPLLLIFDGHKAHPSPPVVEAAKREGVILLHLPRHTSHVLQPLEVGFFGHLEADFATVTGNLSRLKKSNNNIVSRTEFAKIVHHPYQRAKAKGVVVRGFKKCGIFPLRRAAIKSSHLRRRKPTTATTTTGLSSAPPPPIGSSQTPGSSLPLTPSLKHMLVEAGWIPPITDEDYERLLVKKKQQSAEAKKQRPRQRREQANNIALETTNPVATSRKTPSARAHASSPSSSNHSRAISSSKKRKAPAPAEGQKRKRKSTGGGKKTPKTMVDNGVCGKCKTIFPAGGEAIVMWVCCSLCMEWFHCICVQWNHQDNASDEEFQCERCQVMCTEVTIES